MPDKQFYGSQTFLNIEGKNKGDEKTILYKFGSAESRDQWLSADMSVYSSVGRETDKKYHRQKITQKEANKRVKEGTSLTDLSNYEAKKIDGSYLRFQHKNPKYANDFGVVARFEDDKARQAFMDKYQEAFGKNMTALDPGDKRVIAANTNGALLRYGDQKEDLHEPRFVSRLTMSLARYPDLDPARRNLAVIAQKDQFKSPEVYSFASKSFRDAFVKTVNGSKKNLPVKADRLNNFSGIAITHAARNMILKGSLKEHYDHLKEYLAIHNANHKSVDGLTRAPITAEALNKRIDSGEKDLGNLDLRGVTLPNRSYAGFSFKNSDLSSQKLDGLDFSKADLSRANLRGASINGARFDTANLDKAVLKETTADLSPASFKSASLNGTDLNYARLPASDFRDSSLNRANFYKADLTAAVTVGAKLTGTEFNGTNLTDAKMDTHQSAYKLASFKDATVKGTAIENIPAIQAVARQSGSNELPAMAR